MESFPHGLTIDDFPRNFTALQFSLHASSTNFVVHLVDDTVHISTWTAPQLHRYLTLSALQVPIKIICIDITYF